MSTPVVTYDTLLLDQSQWDLVIDASGNIAMAAPPYALAQDVSSAVRTFLGEVYYDTTLGVWTLPSMSNQTGAQVFGTLPPSSLLIELINQEALIVPGVLTAQTFITSFTDRDLSGQIIFTDVNGNTTTVNF